MRITILSAAVLLIALAVQVEGKNNYHFEGVYADTAGKFASVGQKDVLPETNLFCGVRSLGLEAGSFCLSKGCYYDIFKPLLPPPLVS